MLGPVPHGTENGYGNYLCRCSKCKTAHTEYKKSRKEFYKDKRVIVKHATFHGYNFYGCRCEKCVLFMREYYAQRRLRLRREREERRNAKDL